MIHVHTAFDLMSNFHGLVLLLFFFFPRCQMIIVLAVSSSVWDNKDASFGICLQAPFVVMITGRQTDRGTGGDVVFLLSPHVMSFAHSDSAHAKSWQCSASTVTMATALHQHTPPQPEPAAGYWSVSLSGRTSVQWETLWVMSLGGWSWNGDVEISDLLLMH